MKRDEYRNYNTRYTVCILYLTLDIRWSRQYVCIQPLLCYSKYLCYDSRPSWYLHRRLSITWAWAIRYIIRVRNFLPMELQAICLARCVLVCVFVCCVWTGQRVCSCVCMCVRRKVCVWVCLDQCVHLCVGVYVGICAGMLDAMTQALQVDLIINLSCRENTDSFSQSTSCQH